MKLSELTSKLKKSKAKLGRGVGSRFGKTAGRGQKGQGARSGYKRRYGFEGGGMPLYMKLPTKGFSRARFQKKLDVINFSQINLLYSDGETVNLETVKQKGFITGKSHGLKLLGDGELKKKVTFELSAISKSASAFLDDKKLKYAILKK